MTYSQAYDKIIQAYFKDEIKPLDPKFCFCGTLCNNSHGWHRGGIPSESSPHKDYGDYRGIDYYFMEDALFNGMYALGVHGLDDTTEPRYEDALFNGMCAALEVLKQIHIDRGEDVDQVPAFTKRQLQTVS